MTNMSADEANANVIDHSPSSSPPDPSQERHIPKFIPLDEDNWVASNKFRRLPPGNEGGGSLRWFPSGVSLFSAETGMISPLPCYPPIPLLTIRTLSPTYLFPVLSRPSNLLGWSLFLSHPRFRPPLYYVNSTSPPFLPLSTVHTRLVSIPSPIFCYYRFLQPVSRSYLVSLPSCALTSSSLPCFDLFCYHLCRCEWDNLRRERAELLCLDAD